MFAERLAKLLKDSKIKNTELADHLKVSKAAVSKWINGKAEPRPCVLHQIANFFNVPTSSLIDDNDYRTPASGSDIYPSIIYSQEEPERIGGFVWLPVYETKISATPGIQDIVREDIVGWHSAPESLVGSFSHPSNRPFSMKVIGKSMLPLINPGDYLTIRPAPFIVPDPNKIYAVKISDDASDTFGIVVKRVQIDRAKKLLLLRSDNPEYPLYVTNSRKASVIGRVISMWRAL